MTRVLIKPDENTIRSLEEFESLLEPEPQARVYISTSSKLTKRPFCISFIRFCQINST